MQLVEPLVIFSVALVVLWILRRLFLGWLHRKAASPEGAGVLFADAIRAPSVFWCLAGAIAISLRYAELNERQVRTASVWIVIFVIVSLSLAVAAMAVRMITLYGQRQKVPFAVAGLSRTLTYVFVLSIGMMVLMHYLGLDIRPILTALGVGGLAVALALQDTLANFFAGVHILLEEPIRVGHFIRLAPGEEGTVTDIGWRTTRVRTGQNTIIVIPNTKITTGVLINFSLPAPITVIEVPIVVGHSADARSVREIILEEALSTPDVLIEPAPTVLFDPGITPTHQQFRLYLNIEQQTKRGQVVSAFNLKLLERFRADGVPLPTANQIGILRG